MVIVGYKPVFALFAGFPVAPAVIHDLTGQFGAVAGFQEFGKIVVRENIFALRTLEFEGLLQIHDPRIHPVFFDPVPANGTPVTVHIKCPGNFRQDHRFPVLRRCHFQQFFFCGSQLHISGGKGDAPQYSQTKRE